jgi:hypothetical protein
MPTILRYPHAPSGACHLTEAVGIWAVAAQLRRQMGDALGGPAMALQNLERLYVNGRAIKVDWDFAHAVHDDAGRPVFGICETDPDSAGTAYVSVNGPLLKTRPDLLLSTAAHELGHVIFDVPAALAAPVRSKRRYRSFTSSASALLRGKGSSEWRANEFMGALLAPPFRLHRELLHHARTENMALARAPHAGRPTWPVVAGNNDPDTLAGVIAVLAQEFGVSPRFIEVRLARYGLVTPRTGGRS